MPRTFAFGVAVLVLTLACALLPPNTRVAVDKGGSVKSLEVQLLDSERLVRREPTTLPTSTQTLAVPTTTATPLPVEPKPPLSVTAIAAQTQPGEKIGTFRISFYTCAEVANCQTGWPNSTTIATDPSVIPRGSCVIITGIGQKLVDDAGGLVKGAIIDVFLPQVPGESLESVHKRALEAGVQYREVYWC